MAKLSENVYATCIGDLRTALEHIETAHSPPRFLMIPLPQREGDSGAVTLQWDDLKLALTMPYQAITDPTKLPDGTDVVVHIKLEGKMEGPFGMGSVHMVPLSS